MARGLDVGEQRLLVGRERRAGGLPGAGVVGARGEERPRPHRGGGPVNSESRGSSLRAKKNGSPDSVAPTRWFLPSPSSAMISPPYAETVMLSGPSGSSSWSAGV